MIFVKESNGRFDFSGIRAEESKAHGTVTEASTPHMPYVYPTAAPVETTPTATPAKTEEVPVVAVAPVVKEEKVVVEATSGSKTK